MGLLIGNVLVNIIMRKLEEMSIQKFVVDGTTICYAHFVDDILVAIKPNHVVHVHQNLNNIDKNLRCTNFNIFFYNPSLDLELKPRNTGYYVNDRSNMPWVF